MGLRSEYARRYLDCLDWRRPQLVALLHRYGFSWEDCEDAAQQAMIEAVGLIEAQTVESLENRWSWLIRVALNKARTVQRQRRRRRTLDRHLAAEYPAVSEDDDEPVYFARARFAFGRLPPRTQAIFTYVYLDGNSYRDAAKHFRLGIGVISRRLGKARDLLRSEIGAAPYFRARAEATKR